MPEAFLKLPFIPAGETVLSSVNTAAQQIAERPRHMVWPRADRLTVLTVMGGTGVPGHPLSI